VDRHRQRTRRRLAAATGIANSRSAGEGTSWSGVKLQALIRGDQMQDLSQETVDHAALNAGAHASLEPLFNRGRQLSGIQRGVGLVFQRQFVGAVAAGAIKRGALR
jgi:hypothetical protein